MRRLVAAVLVLGLAACASQPTKPDAGAKAPPASPATGSTTSPYPPAQEDPSKGGDYTAGGLYAPHIKDSAPGEDIDVSAIPEPAVVAEPRSRYGNRSTYSVLGKNYHVMDDAAGYVEQGLASYYGKKFHGRRTSNMEVYDMYAFTAAHKTLPLPSYARVTNLSNGRSVVVRVNDRGPFHDGRIIDLSYAAAVKLGVDRAGTARVEVQGLSAGEHARQDYDAVASATSAPDRGAQVGGPSPVVAPSAIDRLVQALPIASANAGERPPQPVPASVPDADAAADTRWRFDMRQDGRTMTADEFDAWMRARRARVATGKPGVPDPRTATAAAATATSTAAGSNAVAATRDPAPVTASPPASAPQAMSAPQSPTMASGVVLQVASFAGRDNAQRALAMLAGAGIDGARLLDADANGRRVWRLRVGPVAAAAESDLVARIEGLGFGQPQRVRE